MVQEHVAGRTEIGVDDLEEPCLTEPTRWCMNGPTNDGTSLYSRHVPFPCAGFELRLFDLAERHRSLRFTALLVNFED